MTRVLRAAFFGAPDQPPLVTFSMEEDLKQSVEVCKHELEQSSLDGLTIVDVLTIEDDADLEATVVSTLPTPEEQARHVNMAILYFYDVAQLQFCAEGGMLMQTIPSPLSREEIVMVFRQICLNSAYRRQTLHALDEDGNHVYVKEGKVTTK